MKRYLIGAMLCVSLVFAACGDDEKPASKAASTGPIAEAEKSKVKVGIELPNLDSNGAVVMAMVNGYYEDEGLEIEVIRTEATKEGLAGGSLDFAFVSSIDLVNAAQQGTGIELVAGHRGRQRIIIAAQPDIKRPEDLKGKPILLGSTPGTLEYDIRTGLLTEAGFDIADAGGKVVAIAGGSDDWVEHFLNGDLAMTVAFARHLPALQEHGANILVDVLKDWPNDSIASTEKFMSENPNTAARFLRATIRGMADFTDPDNTAAVLQTMEDEGYTIDEIYTGPDGPAAFVDHAKLYDLDLTPSQESFDDLLSTNELETVPLDDISDLSQLKRAQEQLDEAGK